MLFWVTVLGCGGGEPARSYCEAVCDWAVGCQATERDVDAAALRAQCLAETRAADPSCGKAEDGAIDPLSAQALAECVSAVDDLAASAECGAFVGSIDEIKQGAPPPACATQGAGAASTFEAGRDATTETGPALCQRYTSTSCDRAQTCVLEDLGGSLPPAAQDALGSPYDLCVERLDPVFTSACVADDLYAPEASIDDVNTARQAARECLRALDAVPCDDLLAGDLPELCAGSFTSTEQATAFGAALLQLAQDYAEYVP